MGAGFIFAVVTLLAEGIRLVVPVSDTVVVYGVLVAGLACIIVAMLLSHVLAVKQHNISSPKVSRDYRIAQISDVHIGSRQGGFMQRIVNKLNSLEPDFIVVTGDLVDSSAVDFLALASIQQLKARTFFTIGNHERYADLEKIVDIAGRLGMTMLRQESIVSDELMFIGIDDADDKNQVALHLPGIYKDPEKFNVLLYHRPVGWESAIEHGIELKLSGHTHNGQIFPFNLLVKQQFNRISGMYQQGNSRLYVSSGTGTWGPLMRLGSMNEISVFDIKPERPG
jgi:predicted MPP superfamily phosphohydrolase